jgi:hypothetical protein
MGDQGGNRPSFPAIRWLTAGNRRTTRQALEFGTVESMIRFPEISFSTATRPCLADVTYIRPPSAAKTGGGIV